MSDLHKLLSQSSINENENFDDNFTTNELRQRHVTATRSNETYDLLEQDLVYLREAVDEVAVLLARQQQQYEQISRTVSLRNLTHSSLSNATSFIQNIIHNQYVTTASGAVIGAAITGPVGFIMGTKVGALVALSGSALGAFSMSIMRHKETEKIESEDDQSTAYNQAML